ncbi:unnamed protein product [Trichogramma brassicae]|uniref:Uncharacterized protein n=1 Tax=Trichogramma brassicae TaxID=86971 RepID=A0A6H5J056_9HYME|nr:unnamed protein product [Trichogramma brassicae]
MSTHNDEPSDYSHGDNQDHEPEIDENIFNHCIASYEQQCNEVQEEERKKIREMWSKGIVDILHEVYNKFKDWQGPPPTLSENYDDEIKDLMLMETVLNRYGCQTNEQRLWLVEFLIRTGYKDVPKVGNDGRPLLHRPTPLLEAAKQEESDLVRELFKIYGRNYTDDSGLTHFHAACWHGCVDAVQKFLDLGEDPNCVWQKSGDSPLHMALFKRHRDVAKCLLSKVEWSSARLDLLSRPVGHRFNPRPRIFFFTHSRATTLDSPSYIYYVCYIIASPLTFRVPAAAEVIAACFTVQIDVVNHLFAFSSSSSSSSRYLCVNYYYVSIQNSNCYGRE